MRVFHPQNRSSRLASSYGNARLLPIRGVTPASRSDVMKPADTKATMDHDDITRYTLELDILERDGTLGDRRASELLRSEFALALNASYLMALSGGDIDVAAMSRSIPREGVARYVVVLELVERIPAMTDEQAGELLRREFQRAQNASHFWRVCRDDFAVTLVARERVSEQHELRAA
jgi:hypothetical protein